MSTTKHRAIAKTRSPAPLVTVVVAVAVLAALGGCRSATPHDQSPLESRVRPVASDWPRSFTDDLDNTVMLNNPPQRLVSLSPNLTEIIFLVGGGEQLIGRTDFCDYPAEAQVKPSIGGIINPSLEKLISLQPDLVLVARGVDAVFLDRLEEMQIPFLGYDPQTLDDVIAVVRRIGRITDHNRQANEAAEALAERRAKVAARHRGADNKLRVLFVLSRDPLFVAGATSFVDDMIRTCGAHNAVRDVSSVDQGRPWPRVSREAVVAADAQLVIIAQRQGVEQPERSRKILAQLQTLPGWREVAAVKAGQVYTINDDLVTIPGPRLIDGLEEISRLVGEAARQYTIQPRQ